MSSGDRASPERTPSSRIDTTVPSVARAYDAMLDGKDNYAVDRALVDEVRRMAPAMYPVTRDNRAWLIRVSRFLAAEAGIGQFIDCGSGLPTAENTHQAVQRINKHAKIIYVDHDPIVLAHGRALLEENDRTYFLSNDFTDPDELFADPVLRANVDLTEPVAFLQVGTLHHVGDEQDPWALMRRYIDMLPSGSYVALTHFYNPGSADPETSGTAEQLEKFLLQDLKCGRFRSYEEITRFFDGLELLEPGIVPVAEWWPDGPLLNPLDPGRQLIIGGVGYKP